MTKENRRTLSRTCLDAISSALNSTWSGLGLIPGLRGKRPVTTVRSMAQPRQKEMWFLKHCAVYGTPGHALSKDKP
jgi:hypothetical protein